MLRIYSSVLVVFSGGYICVYTVYTGLLNKTPISHNHTTTQYKRFLQLILRPFLGPLGRLYVSRLPYYS